MAWTPCLKCGQRFKGEAHNVYVTHPLGDQVERYRFVVCEPCADEELQAARSAALFLDDDGDWCLPEDPTTPEAHYVLSEPRESPRKSKKVLR